jgi:hypothetical protein
VAPITTYPCGISSPTCRNKPRSICKYAEYAAGREASSLYGTGTARFRTRLLACIERDARAFASLSGDIVRLGPRFPFGGFSSSSALCICRLSRLTYLSLCLAGRIRPRVPRNSEVLSKSWPVGRCKIAHEFVVLSNVTSASYPYASGDFTSSHFTADMEPRSTLSTPWRLPPPTPTRRRKAEY